LRDRIRGDESFNDLLLRVKQTVTEAFDHQVYPFNQLVEELDVQRDVSHSPIFDVMVVLQNSDQPVIELNDLSISTFDFESGLSQFDLTWIFMEDEAGQLKLDINYNTDLFNPDTILRMGSHFEELLKSILDESSKIVDDLNILSPSEMKQVIIDFNSKKRDYPLDKTIVDLFEAQVEKTPDHLALIYENTRYTYHELNQASNQVAYYLRSNYQIEPDDLIGTMAHRDQWLIISLLGILKAGAAYLPIDPVYPEKRKDYIIKESRCKVVLTGSELSSISANSNSTDPKSLQNIQNRVLTDNLAYVIYTSGSTGNPKGVMIEHGGFVNMIMDQISGFDISESDRVLQFASPSFDASLSEIFMALLKGAGLVLINKETIEDTDHFIAYIAKHQVSVITFPPVYLNALNKHPLPSVRTIITAGEPCIMEDLIFYSKDKTYFNAYGPTETSVCTSFHRVDPKRKYTGNVPVGKPVANSSVFILDNALNPVPIGVLGEICFAGPGLARGYLYRPELTDEKFIRPDFKFPVFKHKDQSQINRMYKIGDLGRWLPDGNIEFTGRKDDQVKVRGFRIELGEIKNSIKQYPKVKDALVITFEPKSGNRELAAYVLSRDEVNIEDLRAFLAQSLPSYMIPASFILLERFPLTVNGKIDKEALPDPLKNKAMGPGMKMGAEYTPFRNEIEKRMVNVWQTLLHMDKIGMHDNFFNMGGDSIKAIQLVTLLKEKGLYVKARDVIQYPTIAQLAKKTGQGSDADNQDTVAGNVKLTAIITWFFEKFNGDRNHFIYSVVINSKKRLDENGLSLVLTKIQAHHDVLRMKYHFDPEGGISQEICGLDFPVSFNTLDLRGTGSLTTQFLNSYIEEMQTSFDLATGPLMKTVLVRKEDQDQLVIMTHRLVADGGISLRILYEDILNGYIQFSKGESILFPSKTDSFKQWADSVHEYSVSKPLLSEKDYWKAVESTPGLKLPNIHNADTIPDSDNKKLDNSLIKDYSHVDLILSEIETQELLTRVKQKYNAGTDEILLTAVAAALQHWHGNKCSLLTLEGHGRESIIEGMDVSRTVGWFTSTFPVILSLPLSADVKNQVESIKNTIRAVPKKGVGYGILKYITPEDYKADLKFHLKPEIIFNYLGQFDTHKEDLFHISNESTGADISENAKIMHDISILAIIMEQKCHLEITYNNNLYHQESINSILTNMKTKLNEIMEI